MGTVLSANQKNLRLAKTTELPFLNDCFKCCDYDSTAALLGYLPYRIGLFKARIFNVVDVTQKIYSIESPLPQQFSRRNSADKKRCICEMWFKWPCVVKRLTCWNHRNHPNVFINLCWLYAYTWAMKLITPSQDPTVDYSTRMSTGDYVPYA